MRIRIGLVVVALCLASCGQTRSPEAFCATLRAETQRMWEENSALEQAAAGSDNVLVTASVMAAASATVATQYVTLFERLEPVAPEEIRADVVVARDGWKAIKEAQASGSLRESPVGTLTNGAQLMGTMDRLEQYAASTCPPRS